MNLKFFLLYLVTTIIELLLFGVHGSQFEEVRDPFALDPSCTAPHIACMDAEILFKVYDPEDCHQYFECITTTDGKIVPSDEPLRCPDSQYFDYNNQTCAEEVDSCTKACINVGCPSLCTVEVDSLIADEYDCGTYYVCVSGEKSQAWHCVESAPYFNGIACTNYEYSCCNFCTTVCTTTGIEVEDPYDCESYYLCEEEGDVDENLHSKCPEGEYFNSTKGTCIQENEPCRSICNSTSLYSKLHY